jgi:hypothetical protein
MFRRKPSVKNWRWKFWTDGYRTATVGDKAHSDMVEKCVHKQCKAASELGQLKLFE